MKTEKEILEALKECRLRFDSEYCQLCPYNSDQTYCRENLHNDAATVIRCLKRQVELYSAELNNLYGAMSDLKDSTQGFISARRLERRACD